MSDYSIDTANIPKVEGMTTVLRDFVNELLINPLIEKRLAFKKDESGNLLRDEKGNLISSELSHRAYSISIDAQKLIDIHYDDTIPRAERERRIEEEYKRISKEITAFALEIKEM